MVKAKDFKLPFSWEEKRPIIHDRLWYLPDRVDSSSFSFPGWDAPLLFGENFSPDRKIAIEYCSGNGLWILEKARLNPTINFLAVELRFDRARKIWAKIHNMKLPNLIVAWAEGQELTRKFIPAHCVEEIYINFPDPWPKRRHEKLRIVNTTFLHDLHRILKPQGQITVVTDDEDYSKIIVKEFTTHKDFESTIKAPYFTEPPADYGSSFFEELFRGKGKTIRLHQVCKI